MKDFSCTDPSDMHYKQLRERVQYFKGTKEGVTTMCKIFEDMQKEAAEKATMEMAKNLIGSHKLSFEEIAAYTHLTLEQVKELAQNMN